MQEKRDILGLRFFLLENQSPNLFSQVLPISCFPLLLSS